MAPWMGALEDNLEVLHRSENSTGGDWGRQAALDLIKARIRIKSMSFMRGRTFLKKFVIIDEAQNLSPKQMKTLITRAGPGTKIVWSGQHRPDRYALPDGRQLRPHLRRRTLPGLAARSHDHAHARRTLASGGLRD